ncbi:MAG: hypothetical protein V4449_01305 [Patescibacteria group bacterium]
MARDGAESVHKKDPVDAILAGAARVRASRAKLHRDISRLTPAQREEYKRRAEALPNSYF